MVPPVLTPATPAAYCQQVSGQDAPDGISSFEDVDLPPALMENVKRCKYTKPTPVQVSEAVAGVCEGVREGCWLAGWLVGLLAGRLHAAATAAC